MAGRRLGSKNKQLSQKDFKEQLIWAFNKVNRKGEYLLDLAANEPRAFSSLLSRLLPSTVSLDTTITIDLGHALLDANDRLKTMRDVTPKRLEFAADSVAADSVAADSVTADSVAAGSVTADSVPADSVPADSVTILDESR